ncbi:DNA-binding response regulator [Yersinia ruckeri]|nr:DNA-binding response regulator [Yersinia ruckeri]
MTSIRCTHLLRRWFFFNITKFIISSLNCICSIHTIINSYYHSNEVSVFIFKKSKVILKVDTSLNDNEKRVITYILLGLNNKKISKKLNISNKTVSYYRCSIYKKLKINNLSCLFIRFNRHSELLID